MAVRSKLPEPNIVSCPQIKETEPSVAGSPHFQIDKTLSGPESKSTQALVAQPTYSSQLSVPKASGSPPRKGG